MDQEVNLSIKLGELSLSSDISATFVINGPDQVVTGIKEFEDGIDIGENNHSLGYKCLAVGNDLVVGQYNFFYKGIEVNQNDNGGKIYLCEKQPRFPFPMTRISGKNDYTIRMQGKEYKCTEPTSLENILTDSKLSDIAMCRLSFESGKTKRPDYNQLCIWFENPNYYENRDNLTAGFVSAYDEAFTAEDNFEKYELGTKLSGDEIITIVNDDKIQGMRCAKFKGIEPSSHGSVISVEFIQKTNSDFTSKGIVPTAADTEAENTYLKSKGIRFNDFDYDDASLAFIEKPLLSGPANTTTYSSINIGDGNNVMRRCSIASGKENTTEGDFSVALGRRAIADDYCAFVWAPRQYIHSPRSYSFTIGQQGVLSSIIKPENAKQRTMYVGGISGDYMELHKFIYGCISSDSYLLQDLKENLEKMTILDFGGGDISVLNFTDNTINQAKLSSLGLYHPKEGSSDLIWDKNLYSVRIGTDITALGSGCFRNSTTLKDVWMSDSIQSIGSAQFYKCGQLSSIRISKNLSVIASSVFSGCNSLKKLELPEGIITIQNTAFGGDQIDELIINRTTTNILQTAFSSLTNSTVIFKDRTMDEVKQIPNYPWGLHLATSTISTYNNATQEWVKDYSVKNGGSVSCINVLTQNEYDSLTTKDANILYIIKES